jgi:3-oxoadipate enol-lactonase
MISPAWRTFTQHLQSEFRILNYDLRNQGASSRTVSAPSWSDHQSDLRILLDAFDIESSFVLGTSASAILARDFALSDPDRVDGLVLVGPAFSASSIERQRRITKSWLQTLEAVGMRGLFDHIYPLVFGGELVESVGAAGYLALRQSFLMLHSLEEIRASVSLGLEGSGDPRLLAELRVPTLVVVGDDDYLVSASSAHDIAGKIPDGQVSVIPRAGHLPFVEATAVFEHIVAEFISAVTGGGTADVV